MNSRILYGYYAVLVLSGPQLETARFLGMRRTEEQAMALVEEQKDEDKQFLIYDFFLNEFSYCHIHKGGFEWT
jgi:hypothetical protein